MSFAVLALICAVALLGPLLSLPRFLRVPVVIGERHGMFGDRKSVV